MAAPSKGQMGSSGSMLGKAGRLKTPRRSARNRLAAFGPVVTLGELSLAMDIPRAQASTNLARWRAAGHLERLSSGVYFNVAHHPEAPRTHLGLGLDRLLSRPHVIVGGSALYHGGWTTQVHPLIEVAVLVDRNSMRLPLTDCGVQLVPRPARHMRLLLDTAAEVASPWTGLAMVPPEVAIIDAGLMRGTHFDRRGAVMDLPPDEVDPDYLEPDAAERFAAALARFAEIGASMDRLKGIRHRYPMLQPVALRHASGEHLAIGTRRD